MNKPSQWSLLGTTVTFLIGGAQAIPANEQPSADSVILQEVVVTATKREERLFETPQSVTVLNPASLERGGAKEFRDYANSIPALSYSTEGAGYSQTTLRGVTSGQYDVGALVGVYIDDVPIGSSSAFADASHVSLDGALFDLDRIEVLRGPQGTVYGASAMGGLLKYVTRKPDLDTFSGEIRTGLSSVSGGDMGYETTGSVNIPISQDVAALRVGAFEFHDGGYIDNITLNQTNVNSSDVYGGKVDFLVKANERLSVRITGITQRISRDGIGTADYSFEGQEVNGRLTQTRAFEEPFHKNFDLGSATIQYAFDHATLTSVTSYQDDKLHFIYAIPGYNGYCAFSANPDCQYLGLDQQDNTEKFNQELRLVSDESGRLTWIIGAYYTHESSLYDQVFIFRDASYQPTPSDLYDVAAHSTYQEGAAFGDLTFKITDQFDVTGGLRFARNKQTYYQNASGAFGVNVPKIDSSENNTTYLLNGRYRPNEQTTFYARFATGYRPGGPNLVTIDPVSGLPSGPPTFQSDSLNSYELGYRAETINRRLSFDLSAYYIDWSNIIIAVTRGGFGAWANAPGGATIRGAEAVMAAHPTDALKLTASAVYTDAKLSQANADLGAREGERLPNVPHWTGSLSVDYTFLTMRFLPYVGAGVNYISDRTASYDETPLFLQYHLPAYTTADLRAGARFGSVDVHAYVRNLFDANGQQSAVTWRGLASIAVIPPVTIGINAAYHF